MKRVISSLLVLTMIGSLAACANTSQGENKENSTVKETTTSQKDSAASKEEAEEPITVTMYPANANLTSGTVGGWRGDYLLEQGFVLDVWAYSDEKLSAILASGDLPDILLLPSGSEFEIISESGLLLDLEPYLDQLPHLTGNEMVQTAMDYTKEYITNGTLNLIPCGVGPAEIATNTERNAVKFNWELYESIGCPSFSNLDELVDILKQMQKAYPETEDGMNVYAMHLFNSMDTSYFYGIYNYFAITGFGISDLPYFIETNYFDESFDYILDDDSNYKKGLAFFNRLYKEGLLDPESINTERNTQSQKLGNGAGLAGWAAAPGWENSGYYPVYFDEVKTCYAMNGNPYGNGIYVAVNAKCDNLEGVLKYLDMMADPDKLLPLISGPEGELWELNDEGKAVVTDEGKGFVVGDTTETPTVGDEEFIAINTFWIVSHTTMTSFDFPVYIYNSEEAVNLRADSETQRKWKELYGYENYLTMLQDKGNVITEPFDALISTYCTQPTDEQSLIMTAAKDIIVPASWKMVYADTEEEFERIWADAVKDCEELGIQEIFEWRVSELQNGIEIRDSLSE